jgi:hypothetical protein
MAITALTREISKSILASAFAPLFFWSLVIAFAFSHTGAFRLKPKEPKQKAPRVEERRIRAGEAQVGAEAISGTPDPVQGTTVFLSLLQTAARLPQTRPIQAIAKDAGAHPQNLTEKATQESSPRASSDMAFVSVRTNDEAAREGIGAMIPCRLEGPVSNSKDGSRLIIRGVVTDNIAGSSGKILIEAGTKVLGMGHIDALAGRIKSYSTWSLVTANHALRARARLLEYAGGRDGIRGQETSPEPQALQRQAIIRDGVYLYVPDQHEFTLELLGGFRLEDLQPAED